ncbi:hypothetical protein BUALT_Bualt11G0068200 [Buddleja alternifolia]|uniref:Cyclin C-terminal domain-containing protein n=1 Tax=Buddleja alternifolia TaxID=168488 RepID=A0AAV6WTH7_9LAMI|nr:hypothetical protein BUALT_Bualt11G0068200 [Buddleja alternifolia]
MEPLPNLLCKEDDSFLIENCGDDDNDENLQFCSVSESDCEYIEMLIRSESLHATSRLKIDRSWLKCARSDAVKWILETRALFGYHYRTAYLSLIYFDRFFSRMTIAVSIYIYIWLEFSDGKYWATRLLSVACLSLAAKIEESKVRLLHEYYVDGYNFQGNVVQKMELLVLNIMEWKMSYATPFAYLNYFATKFWGESPHKELIIRADELIVAAIEEINVVETRPSIVAASAVLAAYDHQLTKNVLEIKWNLIPSWGSLDKEHMSSCYSILQETARLKSNTPKSIISQNSVVDDSTITSTVRAKRSLNFGGDDQHCPIRRRR